MSEFLRMGGYAAFVWPSFALAAVVIAWNVIAARRSHAVARELARGRALAEQDTP